MVVGNAFNIVILFLMSDYFTMCMPYLSKPNHKFLEFIQPPNLKKKFTHYLKIWLYNLGLYQTLLASLSLCKTKSKIAIKKLQCISYS